MIFELRVLDVAFGVDDGESVLGKREMQGRLRHAGAVDGLVDPEIVADEERFFKRG